MKFKTLICFITVQVFVCKGVLLGAASTTGNAGDAVASWSWQEPQAKVVETGDLQWAPKPFEFQAGESIRYIDFKSGKDTSDGLSKDTPWKHHPWDPDAGGQAAVCQGVHTYVFKQGVVYRGQMEANESGTAETPILLTRDPSWGEGPAVICGSETVTGWTQGTDNTLIPDPDKVWYTDLDWAPRNVWRVGEDSTVTRMALARTPNWTITDQDDIKSQWWSWKNPDKPFDNYAQINGQQRHMGFDKDHINMTRSEDYYKGAIVWTTKGWVMGSPFPARVLAVDRDKGSLTFPGQWGGGPSYKIIRGCRYYLEDKPQYLDSPGEFWFDKKGSGGRLYLRLPDDQNPNQAHIEVAKRIRMIDSRGMSHVHVSGLTFRFTNVYWNLLAAPYWVSHESLDAEPGCVRLLGSGTDIQVTNCTFEHVHRGVRMKAMGPQDAVDQVAVNDNVFTYNDYGAVDLADGTVYNTLDPPMGRLYDVCVMRNMFDHIGLRPDLFGQGEAVEIAYAQTVEVAGNIFDRVCAQGIDVHGAKQNRAATDRPFTRILIHHNKAVDTLLNVDDFGGIETWQGGPAYVYNNISGNPGGYRNWDHVLSPDTEDRFGHAYYLDGAFKNYYFNNIAWGKSKGPSGALANTSAFQQIISYENTFFNNTLYNFVRGSRRQAPQAGRVKFLGNIWQSMGLRVFRDADPARTAAAGNEADAGPQRSEFAIDTDAYARNVFYDIGEQFGVFEPSGRWHKTLQAFQQTLETYGPMAASVGVMAEQSPLRDPAAHDFRPSANSAARHLGARVFVPWSLYKTVAEWNFTPISGDPTRILDEHWCMSPYYTVRDDYYKWPTYPLRGVNVTLLDYQNGPLENWTTGALRFNGRDQYAVLTNEDINQLVSDQTRHVTSQWLTATFPASMQPGGKYQVKLVLHDVKNGLKLRADLNWLKKDGAFGGSNTWGGPAQDINGSGPYTFTFNPVDKPDLGSFALTVYVSPTGDWNDHVLVATEGIAVSHANTIHALTTGQDRIDEDLSTPEIRTSNFLIEAYFQTLQGQTDAMLIRKMDDAAGFALNVNEAGGVTLMARAAGIKASLASVNGVNDGQWHHVIAEADRKAGTFTIYLDGRQNVSGPGLSPEASLANDADLYVAGTPQGHDLNGVIEFIRIAHGTLADARTTIEELYAWQFDGPCLRDFAGQMRPEDGGCAGAINATSKGDR
ncbi:MAG: hypothetical protein K9N55_09935 [Phycisphaerae bacterium]|nr:hypothetical protein [Phycisphaerae bacterium]